MHHGKTSTPSVYAAHPTAGVDTSGSSSWVYYQATGTRGTRFPNGVSDLLSGESRVPELFETQGDWKKITACHDRYNAIDEQGRLWGWGEYCGDGTIEYRAHPTLISDEEWIDVDNGQGYTLAVKSDGSLWSFGFNGGGCLGNGFIGIPFQSYFSGVVESSISRAEPLVSLPFSVPYPDIYGQSVYEPLDIWTDTDLYDGGDNQRFGEGAEVMAVLRSGFAEGVTLRTSSGGSGYKSPPDVEVIDAQSLEVVEFDAEASFQVEMRYAVTGVSVLSQQSPYRGDAAVIFTEGLNGDTASAVVALDESGYVASISVTHPGSYASPPVARLVGTDGSAEVSVDVSGSVHSMRVVSGGLYDVRHDRITIRLSQPQGGEAAAVSLNGVPDDVRLYVTGFDVVKGGSGYRPVHGDSIANRREVNNSWVGYLDNISGLFAGFASATEGLTPTPLAALFVSPAAVSRIEPPSIEMQYPGILPHETYNGVREYDFANNSPRVYSPGGPPTVTIETTSGLILVPAYQPSPAVGLPEHYYMVTGSGEVPADETCFVRVEVPSYRLVYDKRPDLSPEEWQSHYQQRISQEIGAGFRASGTIPVVHRGLSHIYGYSFYRRAYYETQLADFSYDFQAFQYCEPSPLLWRPFRKRHVAYGSDSCYEKIGTAIGGDAHALKGGPLIIGRCGYIISPQQALSSYLGYFNYDTGFSLSQQAGTALQAYWPEFWMEDDVPASTYFYPLRMPQDRKDVRQPLSIYYAHGGTAGEPFAAAWETVDDENINLVVEHAGGPYEKQPLGVIHNAVLSPTLVDDSRSYTAVAASKADYRASALSGGRIYEWGYASATGSLTPTVRGYSLRTKIQWPGMPVTESSEQGTFSFGLRNWFEVQYPVDNQYSRSGASPGSWYDWENSGAGIDGNHDPVENGANIFYNEHGIPTAYVLQYLRGALRPQCRCKSLGNVILGRPPMMRSTIEHVQHLAPIKYSVTRPMPSPDTLYTLSGLSNENRYGPYPNVAFDVAGSGLYDVEPAVTLFYYTEHEAYIETPEIPDGLPFDCELSVIKPAEPIVSLTSDRNADCFIVEDAQGVTWRVGAPTDTFAREPDFPAAQPGDRIPVEIHEHGFQCSLSPPPLAPAPTPAGASVPLVYKNTLWDYDKWTATYESTHDVVDLPPACHPFIYRLRDADVVSSGITSDDTLELVMHGGSIVVLNEWDPVVDNPYIRTELRPETLVTTFALHEPTGGKWSWPASQSYSTSGKLQSYSVDLGEHVSELVYTVRNGRYRDASARSFVIGIPPFLKTLYPPTPYESVEVGFSDSSFFNVPAQNTLPKQGVTHAYHRESPVGRFYFSEPPTAFIRSSSGAVINLDVVFVPGEKNLSAFPIAGAPLCHYQDIRLVGGALVTDYGVITDTNANIVSYHGGKSAFDENGGVHIVWGGREILNSESQVNTGATEIVATSASGVEVSIDDHGEYFADIPVVSPSFKPSSRAPVVEVVIDGEVVSIGVERPGRGYRSAPSVIFEGGGLKGPAGHASAIAVIEGPVGSVEVTNGGSGYIVAPDVIVEGGSGNTSAVAGVDSQGRVTSVSVTSGGIHNHAPSVRFEPRNVLSGISVTSGGSGYSSPPKVVVPAESGASQPTARCSIDGKVVSVAVTAGGSGYTTDSPPVARVISSDGQGSGASVRLIVDDESGRVTSAEVVDGGSGYQSLPSVVVESSLGFGARATAAIEGPVSDVVIESVGGGFREPPRVFFEGGGGSGAAASSSISPAGAGASAVAVLNAGVVRVDVIDGGGWYQESPVVRFTGGDNPEADELLDRLRSEDITESEYAKSELPAHAQARIEGRVVDQVIVAQSTSMTEWQGLKSQSSTRQSSEIPEGFTGWQYLDIRDVSAPPSAFYYFGPRNISSTMYVSPSLSTYIGALEDSGGWSNRVAVRSTNALVGIPRTPGGETSVGELPLIVEYSSSQHQGGEPVFLRAPQVLACCDGRFYVDSIRNARTTTTAIRKPFDVTSEVDLSGSAGHKITMLESDNIPTLGFSRPAVWFLENISIATVASPQLLGRSDESPVLPAVGGRTVTLSQFRFGQVPEFQVEDRSGSGFSASCSIDGEGRVSSLSVADRGSGYTGNATIRLSRPVAVFRRCQATCVLGNSGEVSHVVVDDPGDGYVSPGVVLHGGGGSGALAVAHCSGYQGQVLCIEITSTGSGYKSPPEVYVFERSDVSGDFAGAFNKACESHTLSPRGEDNARVFATYESATVVGFDVRNMGLFYINHNILDWTPFTSVATNYPQSLGAIRVTEVEDEFYRRINPIVGSNGVVVDRFARFDAVKSVRYVNSVEAGITAYSFWNAGVDYYEPNVRMPSPSPADYATAPDLSFSMAVCGKYPEASVKVAKWSDDPNHVVDGFGGYLYYSTPSEFFVVREPTHNKFRYGIDPRDFSLPSLPSPFVLKRVE